MYEIRVAQCCNPPLRTIVCGKTCSTRSVHGGVSWLRGGSGSLSILGSELLRGVSPPARLGGTTEEGTSAERQGTAGTAEQVLIYPLITMILPLIKPAILRVRWAPSDRSCTALSIRPPTSSACTLCQCSNDILVHYIEHGSWLSFDAC